MQKYFLPVLFLLLCLLLVSCERQPEKITTELVEADVSYISQRVHTMICPHGAHSCELVVGDVETVVQDRIIYHPTGEVWMVDHGGSEGYIRYGDTMAGYLPFTEEQEKIRIKINLFNNCIIDVHQYGCDTISDFVILEDLKIIMSEDNYRIFKETRRGDIGERITFYRYK